MKIHSVATIIFFLTLLLQLPISAQTTFEVCDVELAEELLPERSYHEIMKARMVENRNILSKEDRFKQDLNRELLAFPQRSESLITSYNHPFAAAIQLAYAQHRPLTFSPDMVWMLICQGFAKHVDLNSEALRHHFVRHEGKKNINIKRNYLMANSVGYWENILAEFSDSIRNHVGTKMHDLATNHFSTTSSIETTAFEVTLMDAMSSYFDYSVGITCGIPSVTLEGTVEDWEKVERDFEQLAEYDLEWWVNDLMPILHQFTQAAKGEVDKEFWGKIYDYRHFERGMCGSPNGSITGWMVKFFPYLNDDSKNSLIGMDLGKYSEQISNQKEYQSGQVVLELSDFPQGLSKADFVLNNNGDKSKMEFLAGFVGIGQDAVTKTLRPEINWGVVDSGREPTSEELSDKSRNK
ncbi:MAG: DUF4419 domain-containing protein [Chitinophagales bacterium]